MTLYQLLSDLEIINDDTEISIHGMGWKCRGNWYEDHMLKIADEYKDAIVRELRMRDYLDIGRVVEIEIKVV